MQIGNFTPIIPPAPLSQAEKALKSITDAALKIATVKYTGVRPGAPSSFTPAQSFSPTQTVPQYYPQRQAPIQRQNFVRQYWPYLAGGTGLVLLAVILGGKKRRR